MKKYIIPALSTNLLSLEHCKKVIVLDKKGKQGEQNHWYSLNVTSIFFAMKGYEKYNKISRTFIHFKLFSIRLVSKQNFNYKGKNSLYSNWTSIIKKSQSKQEWLAAEARIVNKLSLTTILKDWIAETKSCLPSVWNRNGEDIQCENGIRTVKRRAANLWFSVLQYN